VTFVFEIIKTVNLLSVDVDLCEDIEVKQQIAEIIETVRNRHKKVVREGDSRVNERRRSSARRSCYFQKAS